MTRRRGFSKGSWLMFALLASSLAGCGFQLRGQQEGVESNWEALSLNCGKEVRFFCESLTRQLRQAGTEVAFEGDSNAAGFPVLTVLDSGSGRRAVTLTSDARAAEYEVSRSIVFEVTEGEATLIPRTEIRQFQTYRYDTESVLGKEREEREIQEDLDQLLARQVANRLALEKIKATLPTDENQTR